MSAREQFRSFRLHVVNTGYAPVGGSNLYQGRAVDRPGSQASLKCKIFFADLRAKLKQLGIEALHRWHYRFLNAAWLPEYPAWISSDSHLPLILSIHRRVYCDLKLNLSRRGKKRLPERA
jgi:hypothetical protein